MKGDDTISNLDIERGYTVVKSNNLIQNARFNLSLTEQKTLAYIISKIKPTDESFKEYSFSILEYCQICGIDYNSGANYAYVKDAIKKLRDKSFWIISSDGSESLCSWVSKVKINKRSGIITLQLDDELKPFLLQLKERFTQYELINILPMKSQYSIRLYELFKSYAFAQKHTFDIMKLKRLISAENYIRFPDFRRNVLDVALNEINQFTDIKVTYEAITKGRKVEQITFSITKVTPVEELISHNKARTALTKKD